MSSDKHSNGSRRHRSRSRSPRSSRNHPSTSNKRHKEIPEYSSHRQHKLRNDKHRQSRTDHDRPRIKQEQINDESSRSHYDRKREDTRHQRKNKNFLHKSDDENYEFGKPGDSPKDIKVEPQDKEKPNFETTGNLAADTNTFNGIVIKYNEPPEARKPRTRWRLYPFKGDESLEVLQIHRQSAYLLGRERRVADIPIHHPSCSKQHAALQYRLVDYKRKDDSNGKRVRLFLIDLNSANGTFLNNKQIEAQRYYELMEKDMVKFGYSSREYILLHEGSKEDSPDIDQDDVQNLVVEDS